MEQTNTIIKVEDLRTYFDTDDGVVKAVDGVSFEITKGETLGVVGESGCGKSITAFSLLQLVPRPKGKIVSGKISYYTKDSSLVDITALKPNGREIREIRGNEIAMIFQEPLTSLNPVYTVGNQIIEAIRLHQRLEKVEARELAVEMLAKVGIPEAQQRVDAYPHEFSGGMRQRAMIAMALSCNPRFLIADEPTTALDVTIEAQILNLIRDLQESSDLAVMIITHDLGVVADIADHVMVMYCGKVVERASTVELFDNPKHPYTVGLLDSIPKIGKTNRLTSIKGIVPSLNNLPNGCYFSPRCPQAMEKCFQQEPDMYDVGSEHTAKCWLHQGEA